jgi:hypothetical protein
VAYIAFFFTLNHTPHTDRLVTIGDITLLSWYVMECYAGVCQQTIAHIHGIIILQGPRTIPWYERALCTLHPNNFINVASLQWNSRVAWLYIQRQLINPLRIVHYLTNHVEKKFLDMFHIKVRIPYQMVVRYCWLRDREIVPV